MFTASDLPEVLPLFPLTGALLLPRGHLPLHIFEPRYLTMVDATLRTDGRLIGMIQPVSDTDDAPFHRVGCAGRITSFNETPDQTYMITLSGISRFEQGEIQEGSEPYMRAKVRWPGFAHDLDGEEFDTGLERPGFLKLLGRYFDTTGVEVDIDGLKDAEDEVLLNALASMGPFESEDKQALLEAQTLSQRRLILITLMEFTIRGTGGVERIQ